MPMNETYEGGRQDDDQDPSDLPERTIFSVGAANSKDYLQGGRAVRDAVLVDIPSRALWQRWSMASCKRSVPLILIANLLRAGDSDTTS